MTTFEFILVEPRPEIGVTIIRLNRPKELNALNRKVMEELVAITQQLDKDDSCRCIILTGNDKAFAAGADIKEMAGATSVSMLNIDQFAKWDQLKKTKKPIIAAVSGFALGGGCELAMICDMIVASETAKFDQLKKN